MKTHLNKMVKKELIKKLEYGSCYDTGYYITVKGMEVCSAKLRDFIMINMPDDKHSNDYNTFNLDDIINYLYNRCLYCKPKYWRHYLAARDIFAYLLAKSISDDFQYEAEVAIDASGRTATLYTRSLYGLDLKYEIRSDGLLTYKPFSYLPNFRFIIEVDNGSQSSKVIIDKVKKYISGFVEMREFNPSTSLLFCLNTELTSKKSLGKDKIKSSTADYYYGLILENVYELLVIMGLDFSDKPTIGELITHIKKIEKSKQSKVISQVISYINDKESIFKDNIYIKDIHDLYKVGVEERHNYIKLENDKKHQKKYIDRRALIHRSIIEIPELHAALLKGLSIYTVSNYDLDKTFPYICMEMTGIHYHFIKILMRYNYIISINDIRYYTVFNVRKTSILLRNFYNLQHADKGFALENITDDLGGYYRVLSLLDQDTIPAFIQKNVTLMCLSDNKSIDIFKEKYLETKHGKILSKSCTDYIKDEFEVLFITYEDIVNEQRFFTFSSSGERIYKDKSLTKATKGVELPF